MLKDARVAASGPVISLAFGIDSPIQPLSGAAVSLATSKSYHVPEAIAAIARDRRAETLVHEKSGFSPEEALELGFRPEEPADIFQQIWLASLGGTASVWTSHPGADTEQGRPSY